MPQSVYSPEADEEHAPVRDSGTNQNTPARNPTDPRGHDVAANNPSDPRGEGLDNVRSGEAGSSRASAATGARGTSGTSARQAAQPGELRNAESKASPQDNFSYTPEGTGGRGKKTSSTKTKLTRRAIMLALGGGGGAVTLAVLGFFLLIPLKIESIVTDLTSHFFSTSSTATETETDNMFSSYMKNILPALHKCGDNSTEVIDKHCNPSLGNGNNPVSALYIGWHQARLENKLAENYGIEFKYDKAANGRQGQWYLKTPNTSGNGEALGNSETDIGKNLENDFVEADRADMRAAIKDQTKWYNVMLRYKVGTLLEEKYGIRRCLVWCGVSDPLAKKVTEQKYAAKVFLIDRVITPRFAALGNVMGCILLANNKCDGKAPSTECAEETCDELAGEAETNVEASTAEVVGAASSGFGSETAGKLIGFIGDMRRAGGFSNYAINKVATQLVGHEVDQNDLDEVPGIGELQMLNQGFGVINILQNLPKEIQRYSYIVNAGAAVSMFSMYETYADEIHTGHVTATEVGSFTNSLGPGNQCDATIEGTCPAKPVNGTAEAENTPLYSSLIEGDPTPVQSKTYLCNNNSPVPPGKLVCPEEDLSAKSQTATSIQRALNETGLGGLASAYKATGAPTIFNALNSVTNSVVGLFVSTFASVAEDALSLVGEGSLISQAEHSASKIFEALADDIIPSPISADESGGRTFDMMAAGADVSGNDFAHTGQGGQKLTSAQVASITQQQENDAQQQFQSQPLFARLFSTSTPYSLVSKVAVDIPFGLTASLQGDFASFLNPLSTLSSTFGSLFSGHSFAAATAQPDPFGVTQYGYPPGTIPANPEQYWTDYCSNNASQGYQKTLTQQQIKAGDKYWNDETTTDPDNGQQVNTTPNPCMLIESAVGSAGATSNSSLLTPDEQADINNGSSTSASGSLNCTTATGNPKILCEAEQYNGIYYLGGGGHAGYPAFSQACSSSVLASAASTSTAADPGPCATDCSGLVSVAASEAFGQNFSWTVATLEQDTTDWKPISITSVQPGDVVTQGTDTHVEIVNHYDASTQTMYTFGSHETGQQTSLISQPASKWSGAYTYIGPGSS